MAKKATRKRKGNTVEQGTQNKGKSKAMKKPDRTDEEEAQLEAYRQRSKAFNAIRFQLNDDNDLELQASDDPLTDARFAEALGTTDSGLRLYLFFQAVRTFQDAAAADHIKPHGVDRKTLVLTINYAAALLAGIRPQDELESMLAVQMIGCHNAAMHALRAAMATGQTFEGRHANVNYATKLLQVFTSQMEAFRKRRTGGQQKMVVEHVHVNEGGQAVVGAVNVGGGSGRTVGEPHAQ